MTRTIDKAVKHFDSIAQAKMEEIYVEAWDTTVYFRPVMTWAEQSKLIDLSTQGKSSEALIETLVIRAKERDGSPMFSTADRTLLKNSVDPDIIVQIVTAMNRTQLTLEEVEKN